jgi:hypothetical protein
VLVSNRGMLTKTRPREDLDPVEGLDWITGMRAPAIVAMMEAGGTNTSVSDQQDLAEVT